MKKRISLLLTLGFLLASCRGAPAEQRQPSAARGALITADVIALQSFGRHVVRRAAPLGVFVSEYLSVAPLAALANGAVKAVAVQSAIIDAQQNVTEPDFELLQAFSDALQVDVSDLLNRSPDRKAALDAYSEALTNVATRANDRFRELTEAEPDQSDLVRALRKEVGAIDRAIKGMLKDKDFTGAAEQQKLLTEKQSELSKEELKLKQSEEMINTLDTLLTIYGERILAIQQNREALITGVTVVDVPGIDDLKLIERTRTRSRRSNEGFDDLFEVPGML